MPPPSSSTRRDWAAASAWPASAAREADCTIAIDGCALQCAKLALQRHGMEPGCYVVVTELGIEKSRNFELSEEQIAQVVEAVKSRRGEAGEGSSDAGCSCCSED